MLWIVSRCKSVRSHRLIWSLGSCRSVVSEWSRAFTYCSLGDDAMDDARASNHVRE